MCRLANIIHSCRQLIVYVCMCGRENIHQSCIRRVAPPEFFEREKIFLLGKSSRQTKKRGRLAEASPPIFRGYLFTH